VVQISVYGWLFLLSQVKVRWWVFVNTVRYFGDHKDTTVAAGSKLFINHTKQFRIIYRSVAIPQPVVNFRPSVELPVALNFRFEAVFTETEAQKEFSSGHLCCCFYTHKSTLKAFSYSLFPWECDTIYHFILPSSAISAIRSFHRYFSHIKACLLYMHTFSSLGQRKSNVVTYFTGVNFVAEHSLTLSVPN
jgi:hypothetical protein